MKLADLADQEKQAFLDLLVLAMYADGHLASAEDERIVKVLTAFGFESEYDRGKQLDASVTRARQRAETRDAARHYAASLAETFTSPDTKQAVFNALAELVAADSRVSPEEKSFLGVIREVLAV